MYRLTAPLALLFTLAAPFSSDFISFAEARSPCPCYTAEKILEKCKAVNQGHVEINSKVYGPTPGRSKNYGKSYVKLVCFSTEIGLLKGRKSQHYAGTEFSYSFSHPLLEGPGWGAPPAKRICNAHNDTTDRGSQIIDLSAAEVHACFAELMWVKGKLHLPVRDKN